MAAMESQDSAAEDVELIMDEINGGFDAMDRDMERVISEQIKPENKVYTPMNKEEFDFLKT